MATGRGCLLYKWDLKKAYRQFPVDPRDYHLLSYNWQDEFYFDTVLTMGLCSAAMACQHATPTVSWICYQRGQSVFNYLDDFIGVTPPSTAVSALNNLGDLFLLSVWSSPLTRRLSRPLNWFVLALNLTPMLWRSLLVANALTKLSVC